MHINLKRFDIKLPTFNLILFNLSSIMVANCSFLLKENKSCLLLQSVGSIKSIPHETNKYRKELPTLISHHLIFKLIKLLISDLLETVRKLNILDNI